MGANGFKSGNKLIICQHMVEAATQASHEIEGPAKPKATQVAGKKFLFRKRSRAWSIIEGTKSIPVAVTP